MNITIKCIYSINLICTLQAVRCILEGLENFNQNSFAKEIVGTSLSGQTLIAEITHRDQVTGCVKAVLHDTSKSEDLNMNQKLLDVIMSEETGLVVLSVSLVFSFINCII